MPTDVPLIVALHHPPYSADDHRSGSTRMIKVLDEATAASSRRPDLVIARHVHNYQRLTRTLRARSGWTPGRSPRLQE
ncbi:MAG TPA: metallophosphoesterase family protein [Sporichthyaceae bacterium]|nr:metallophosphoesterase family protein [Sporichthyaceae bacterium]